MTIKVVSVAETRQIEAEADRGGFNYAQMMLNAGRAASAALQSLAAINGASRILFLIGKGNNGGDGLVMALDLASRTSADVRLYLLEDRGHNDSHFQAAVEAGIAFAIASDDADGSLLAECLGAANIVVDALFGIGLRLPLRAGAAALLDRVNQGLSLFGKAESGRATASEGGVLSWPSSRPFVFAIDCPSGVDCDSGQSDPNTIRADATISFIAAKAGLLTFPAAGLVGDLIVSQIGLPDDLPALQRASTTLMDSGIAASLLPPRPLDGHKGTFGKVMLVAGSQNYIGAVALAGEAACRSGAGLVTIATTRRLIDMVAGRLREPTWLALSASDGAIDEGAAAQVREASEGYDALLIGCGLGIRDCSRAFVERVVLTDCVPPLILDADALNALSQKGEWWQGLPGGTIITPHSGEMARLTGMTTAQIMADRWGIAREFAVRWNVVVVLKGAHSIIADPAGNLSVTPFKTDALGTAGTGDVLAGLIAGLRAQGASAFDSARLGAFVHGLAGTIAAESIGSSRSVIAGDVLAALGSAYHQIERA